MSKYITTRSYTYLGRRAEVTTIGSQALGRREIITRWIDDADERNGGWAAGTITTRTVKGDGWRGRVPFETIHAERVMTVEDRALAAMDYADARAEGDAMMIERARERYFVLMAMPLAEQAVSA